MKNIFITLDYELFFGSNSGTLHRSIIEPTNKLLEVLDRYNIKATFFVDSGYIIKLKEFKDEFKVLEKDYEKIISQIKHLHQNGHDIQLHIHPHWEDCYYDGQKWIIDTTRYKLHDFSEKDIETIVFKYKKVLTNIVGDTVFVYRAGGWCIQPFSKIYQALKKNNIWMDSTLFYGGYNESSTHYLDFRNMPKKTKYNFDTSPLNEDINGYFTEVAISSHQVSPLFFWKLAFLKKFGSDKYKSFGDGKAASSASKWNIIKMLTQYSYSVVSIDGVKSSFLDKAYKNFAKKGENNFVILGHPKAMSQYSLEQLDKFIAKRVKNNFTIYSKEFNNEK